ncbi:hypothetical protein [Shewanella sp. UCD-KL12]|uniref:hypothetical protein n=1 Tax=Shewanella sp. UCD-KL12 TaxID=1917163 RepID=UPI000970DD8D|nr:hypothetical protein [Shewanella sp. UCD-KL12]
MKTGLEKCFEALDRIKANKPIEPKFVDLPKHKVTAAVISQEAGFDSGYLKKKRLQHQPILSLIGAYKSSDTGCTLSVHERTKREKRKVESLRVQLDLTENKLHNALAREVLLLDQIDNMERELAKFGVNS